MKSHLVPMFPISSGENLQRTFGSQRGESVLESARRVSVSVSAESVLESALGSVLESVLVSALE